MNLLVASSWMPYPLDNGSRVRAFYLLRHLAQRHTITLLTFGLPHGGEDLGPLREFCADVHVAPPTAVDRSRLGLRGLLSPVPRYFVQNRSPTMEALVTRYVPGRDAAVALQVDAARYLRGWPEIPKVFEEVEVAVPREQYLNEHRAVPRARRALTWWKFRRYIQRLVQDFDRTTVVSEQERNLLQLIGCDAAKVAVVPNGVELGVELATRQERSTAQRSPRLIYPGSVMYSANLDAVRFFITDILPLIRRERPDVEFWITGATDGVDVSALAGPNVHFTGRLPEVESAIAASAACVVPLRIGGGTRLKVLQAMALGTPVVSTNKGIEGLDVTPGRHVLTADTPEAFAAQTLQLLGDSSRGAGIVKAAEREVAEKYAWRGIAEGLERVIEAAVDEHGRRGATRA